MKSFIRLSPILVLLLLTLLTSCATTTIVLRVDTDNITAETKGNELEAFCQFDGQKEGGSLKSHITDVKKGNNIKWVGISKNGKDSVNIELIQYMDGTNPFPNNEVNFPGKGKSNEARKVKTKAKRETQDDQNCIYLLMFSIDRKENPINKNFIIDPELRIKSH